MNITQILWIALFAMCFVFLALFSVFAIVKTMSFVVGKIEKQISKNKK